MRNRLSHPLTAGLGLVLLLAGCEKAVFVEIPDRDQELVISGFFSPDSLWQIDVSSSVTYSSIAGPQRVDGASVQIWDGDLLVDELAPLGRGRYRSHRSPDADREYTLKVTSDGFEPVRATGRVPRGVVQATARALPSEGTTGFGTLSIPIKLTLEDPEGTGDYYGLAAGVTLTYREPLTGRIHSESRRSNFTSRDLVLREDDPFETDELWFERALFNDDVLEGRSSTIDFTVRLFDIDPAFASAGQVSIDLFLMSISEDFYLHGKTVKLQEDFGDSPFSEPVQIHSNTSNGFGIFAGYQVRHIRLPIRLGS